MIRGFTVFQCMVRLQVSTDVNRFMTNLRIWQAALSEHINHIEATHGQPNEKEDSVLYN